MKYKYYNLGDEIQSIAASRFLPHIDYYVYRENLNSFHGNKAKLILNGWFMWSPDNFPPSENLEPLLVSFYAANHVREKFSSNENIKHYLIEHGPVGCRDTSTMNFLQDNGIPAYFSGCLTLTLRANEQLKAAQTDKYILCVDVPDDIIGFVKRNSDKPVYSITKGYAPFLGSKDRFSAAKILLLLYHNAFAVITTNLHTTLPCLAFNTPVCLVEHNNYNNDARFKGLDEFFTHYSQQEFLAGNYDFNNPPENPDTFRKTRSSLIETCKSFTGFDSDMPAVPSLPDDIIAMLHTTISEDARLRTLYACSGREVTKLFVRKVMRKLFPAIFR